MKILVFSDSHRNVGNMVKVLDNIGKDISYVLHLGDCCCDILQLKKRFKDIEFFAVNGNCDFGEASPEDLSLKIGGKSFYMTHGHRYNVKLSYDRISYKALELSVDVCLFGHTHIPCSFYEGSSLLLNPGSISLPRLTPPSYGVIDIDDTGVIRPGVVSVSGKIIC